MKYVETAKRRRNIVISFIVRTHSHRVLGSSSLKHEGYLTLQINETLDIISNNNEDKEKSKEGKRSRQWKFQDRQNYRRIELDWTRKLQKRRWGLTTMATREVSWPRSVRVVSYWATSHKQLVDSYWARFHDFQISLAKVHRFHSLTVQGSTVSEWSEPMICDLGVTLNKAVRVWYVIEEVHN